MAKNLKIGEKVKMVNCPPFVDADKIWVTRSEPWILCGTEVILLEGKSGGFSTDYLERVADDGI